MAKKATKNNLWNALANEYSSVFEGYSVADVNVDDLKETVNNYDDSDIKEMTDQFTTEVTGETLRKSVG